jgi:hypothetical protein
LGNTTANTVHSSRTSFANGRNSIIGPLEERGKAHAGLRSETAEMRKEMCPI